MGSTTIDRVTGLGPNVGVKAPCRVATTANIILSGLQTIDGVTVVESDRVLVKNQNNATENGVYLAKSNAWTRAVDFDDARDFVTGTRLYVYSGTDGIGEYVVMLPDDFVIGEDDITIEIAASSGNFAPLGADYLTRSANPTLTTERVVTDTASVAWDWGAAGQAKAGIVADSVTNSLLANMASATIKGRATSGTGDPEDLSPAQVRALLDLEIGTDVQAYDPDLTALAGLAKNDGNIIVGDGSAWVAESGGTARESLGLAIGTDVQAFSARLDDIAEAAWAQGDILYFDGSNLVNLGAGADGQFLRTRGASANPEWATLTGGGDMLSSNNLSDVADPGTARTNLGLAVGTDIQAYDADLAAVAANTTNGFWTRTGAGTGAARSITSGAGVSVSNGNGVAGNPTIAADIGKQSIWVPAAAMTARITNGAAIGLVETTTNKVMISTLDFDASTQEFAQFSVRMPKSWDEGTVTFVPVWSHASTTTNFGVVWGLQGVALSNDDAADAAFGTAQTSTDTGGTTNDIYQGPESSAITIGNSPAEGDLVVFQVYRDPANGSDTMAIDARLHGVLVLYTINALKDD